MLCCTIHSFSQIGINTDTPDVKATLDIKINPLAPGGLIIPRMPQSFRININTVGGIGFPIPNSLMIFDTDLNKFTYYDTPTNKWLYLNPLHAISIDPSNGIAGGRIGIGTITPITDLHIKGKTYFEGSTTTTGSTKTNTLIVPGFPDNSLIPAGVIVMLDPNLGIPTGWAMCDGTNGTPDLRDRFIIGAWGSLNAGDTGGSFTTTITTNQLPSHSHNFSGNTETRGDHGHDHLTNDADGEDGYANGWALVSDNSQSNRELSRSAGDAIRNAGNHSHPFSGTTTNTGNGDAINITPPYYALVYIMKLP